MCDNRSKVKDIFEFGSYPFEADSSAKPIKWIILKQDGNKVLLLSAYGLDAKPYNKKWESITWETCTLRKWLNEDFYNAAFSDEEKKQIITTNVQNTDNPKYNTPGGNDTEEKVFLLSIDEAEQYLTEFERRLPPTPYAVKSGASTWNGNCWWWLRSPGDDPKDAALVGLDGRIHDDGSIVDGDIYAVCPALWINLES